MSFVYSGICEQFAPLPLRCLFLNCYHVKTSKCAAYNQAQDILRNLCAVKRFLSSPLSLTQLHGRYLEPFKAYSLRDAPPV